MESNSNNNNQGFSLSQKQQDVINQRTLCKTSTNRSSINTNKNIKNNKNNMPASLITSNNRYNKANEYDNINNTNINEEINNQSKMIESSSPAPLSIQNKKILGRIFSLKNPKQRTFSADNDQTDEQQTGNSNSNQFRRVCI
jgi:hypothetical protein